MNTDRLAEIRALLSDSTACEFADLTATCGELLAELDRLRAAAEGMEAAVRTMLAEVDRWEESASAERDCYERVLTRGRELGLFTPASPQSPAGAA